MQYPLICLIEKATQYKMFIIPQKDALMKFAKNIRNNDEQTFAKGVEIFTSLLPSTKKDEMVPTELSDNNVKIYSVEVNDLAQGIDKFEKWTIMTPEVYDVFYLMNSQPLQAIEVRDWNCINEIVSINKEEEYTPPAKLKLH